MLTLKKIRSDQAGFTLVEIAIVMVIIGLLIGGVLKGQAMIENAKSKRVAKQADEIRAAVLTFFDKYGVFPGDENLANVPPGGGDAAGNSNGQISNTEAPEVFRDLSLAGLISGSFDGTNLPTHSYGGNVDVVWVNPPGATSPPAHYIRFRNMPANVCLEIDTKFDDGVFNTGTIEGNVAYTPGSNIATLWVQF